MTFGTPGLLHDRSSIRSKAAQNNCHSVFYLRSCSKSLLLFAVVKREKRNRTTPLLQDSTEYRLSDRLTCPHATKVHWPSHQRPHPVRFQTRLHRNIPQPPCPAKVDRSHLCANHGALVGGDRNGGRGARAKPKLGWLPAFVQIFLSVPCT